MTRFTPRELEVLKLVAEGFINKEIAQQLGTSEQTIKNHKGTIQLKAGAVNAVELTHFALAHGIVPNMFAEDAKREKGTAA